MHSFDLEMPLIEWADKKNGSNWWKIRNAVEGVQIFGGIGSGKTSGSGRFIALKYLAAGFGGLVLTVKPDEKELWREYCHMTGRTNDLLVIEPNGQYRFNFLDYESEQASGNAITENIVQVLKTVIRAGEEKSGGKSDDPFWETALDMLIFHVIDLCKLAYGRVSVQAMYDIVQALPKENAEAQEAFTNAQQAAKNNVAAKIKEWTARQSVETLSCMQDDDDFYDSMVTNSVPEARLLKLVDQFFSETFKNLAEKTRSIIDFSFLGFLFRLLREPFHSLFCSPDYNIRPEQCWDGKIILINLPVKLYHKIGRDSQIMFKYIWQRAMEKRSVRDDSRPVFLWADEAQNFLHEHDAEYQATARSSKIATVYISQNLPNYHANMGGAKSEFKVKSFLGTLSTKIFHANADIETNKYASDLIGDGYFEDTSRTATAAGNFSASSTQSLKIDKLVRPEDFAWLKTGGPANGHFVGGYVHLQGQALANGNSHIKMKFNQKFAPSSQTFNS